MSAADLEHDGGAPGPGTDLERERLAADLEREQLEREPAPVVRLEPHPPPIAIGSRTLAVGMTGTGKSEGIGNLFAVYGGQRLLVDSSDAWSLVPDVGGLDVDRVRDLDFRYRTIRYVPQRGDAREYDDLFHAIFRWAQRSDRPSRGFLVMVDEAEDVAPSSEIRRYVRRTWKQGRKWGLTVVAATQRPVGVDRAVVNQAEHVMAFPMTDPDDLGRLAPRFRMSVAELADELARLPRYGYLRGSLGHAQVWRMAPLPVAALEQTRRHLTPAP